jgi:cyclohexanecarboxylate-CoA ligase
MRRAAASAHGAYRQLTAAQAGVHLGAARLARERELGFWPDRVLTDYFDENIKQRPDAAAVISCRADADQETTYNWAELDGLVNRIAAKLRELHIAPGDVVSFQLPNGWQFIAVHLACVRIGAISNPLVTIYRARELEFMLRHVGAKLLVVPKNHRGFDHEILARQLQQKLPSLRHVLVVGGAGDDTFDAMFKHAATPAPRPVTRTRPDDIVKLMFTSGTTGEPKAVMHTSNTLLTAVAEARKRLQLTEQDVLFMPSPLAHSIGFLYGMMMAVCLGATLVTLDHWNVPTAIDLIERHRITYIFAAAPFLLDLVNAPDSESRALDSLRLFVTSGAPVPPALIARARGRLHAAIVAGWGMTETGFVTSTLPSMESAGIGTDGRPLPCSEVRVVDDDGREVARGATGRLQYRGSTLFVGYFKRPDLYAVDTDGWFNTGDLAVMNEAGYIRIAGREKDIIIRGGVNVPAVEVERLLYDMPQIREVAVVAMPDPRLGEKGCAFVSLQPGCRLTLRDIQEFMIARQTAKQYMPERLEILDELPKTPSGKIQKFILREKAVRISASA